MMTLREVLVTKAAGLLSVLVLVQFFLLTGVRPTLAQTSLLDDVRAERAKYGALMTPAQVAQMLNAVVWNHRSEGWGLLRKGSGNSCPLGQTFVSCDILIHAPSIQHFDVLRDAENTALPQWSNVGPCVLSDSSGCEMSRFLSPVDPGQFVPVILTGGNVPTANQPTAPPVVVQTQQVDLSPVLSVLSVNNEQAERIYRDLVARLEELRAKNDGLSAQLKQHDESPTFVGKLFGSRYTQIIMGAAAAWLTAQQTGK